MKLVEGIFNTLMAVFLFICILLYVPRLWGFEIYAVTNESKDLPLAVGDAIFVKERSFEDTNPGDMITYSLNKGATTVTGVVADKDEDNQIFQLQKAEDITGKEDWISAENVLGVVWHKIHGLGYLASVTSSVLGKLFLIAIFLWLLSAQMVIGNL